ncbi:MAG TPA: glycosyltransferase [Polyangiaceae bacterium]|nr:glycosyltransferase [Polyangiaceae bacterium]
MNDQDLLTALRADSDLPRVAMVSTHGYVAAEPPLGAADTGGQVVYVLELAKKLALLGYEVDVWTRQFDDQPSVEPVDERVRIVRIPCGGRGFVPKEHLHKTIPEWVENALRFMRHHGLTYRFLDSHYWDAGLAGQLLCPALGIPHVHTPHSLGVWKERQMRTDFPDGAATFEATYNFTERNHSELQIYREADLVIATTPVQTDMLRQDYDVPLDKLRMIPPGYDDHRFFPVGARTRDSLRRRFGLEGKVVLALGRIARNKGYDLLLRAFAEVALRHDSARLHFAIGGAKLGAAEHAILNELRALAETLDLSDRVTFAGYVPETELADLYRAADVFVLCSRYEPFGMTAIEAMACGTPTVVTTHGGLFRILRFGVDGLFADTFDPADLGLTLLKPLRHERLAERMARNGAQLARSLFTWTGVAHQLIGAVEEREDLAVPLAELEKSEQWFGPLEPT